MRLFRLLPVAVLIVFVAACGKSDCNGGYPLYLECKGFDGDTMTPLIVTQYSNASSFSDAMRRDTFFIDSNTIYERSPDTGGAYRLVDVRPQISAPYDWQIDIPSVAKRYRISGIRYTDGKQKRSSLLGSTQGGDACYNVCTDYYLNGSKVQTGLTEPSIGHIASVVVFLNR